MNYRSAFVALSAAIVFAPVASARAQEKSIQLPSRGILRKIVDRDGNVSGELAEQGIKTATVVTYKILLVQNGMQQFVDEGDYVFKLGQQFRLAIEVDSDLYLFVLHEAPDGKRSVLIPDPQFEATAPKAKKGSVIILPDDNTCFEFVPPTGTERLLVLASPKNRPTKELIDRWDELFKESQQLRSRGLFAYGSATSKQDGKTHVAASADPSSRPELYLKISLTSK